MDQPPVQLPFRGFARSGPVQEPQVLRGDPRGDLSVDVADVEPGQQPVPGDIGQVFVASAQHPADRVQRITLTAAVSKVFLLDTTPDIVDGGEPEAGDV